MLLNQNTTNLKKKADNRNDYNFNQMFFFLIQKFVGIQKQEKQNTK